MINKEKAVPFIIVLVLLVIYVAFPTKNYYWDGIEFAHLIENTASFGTSLLHPNHLFYNAFCYAIYKAVRAVGIDARALTVLQTIGSVLSALAAFVLFHVLKLSFRSNYLAAALTFLFSFSALWWKFSTDANSYVPSVLFIIIGFYLIHPARAPKPLAVALTHTLAMCFHQLAVFFFPVALLGLYFQASTTSNREKYRRIVLYGAVAFVLTFGAYALSFYLQTANPNPRALFAWLTSYSPENGFIFNFKDCFRYSLNGQVKLFFGGRFNFLREVLGPFTILLLGVLAAALLGLIVQVIRSWKANKSGKTPDSLKRLAWLCVLWAAVYILFLFFWIPQNTFYRMFYLPAVITLIGILLNKYRSSDRIFGRTALFVVIAGGANFLFFIYPYAQVRKETPLALALEMNKVWSPATVVYYSRIEADNRLVQYFNPATKWVKLENDTSAEKLDSELRRVYQNGGEVWMETFAISQFAKNNELSEWFNRHTAGQPQYKVNDPAYNVVFVKIAP